MSVVNGGNPVIGNSAYSNDSIVSALLQVLKAKGENPESRDSAAHSSVHVSGYNLRKRGANDIETPSMASAQVTELLGEFVEQLPSDVAQDLIATVTRQGEWLDALACEDLCAFVVAAAGGNVFTPDTYQQAVDCEQSERWKDALQSEVESLYANSTWNLVERAPGMKVIPCKWVFKIKTDQHNQPVRYKCRLVAGGHRQKFGIDYEETFAPVSKNTTVRVLLSVAGSSCWKVRQLDVSTAFLHGDIGDTEVFMEQPEGFGDGTSKVCKLEKCLYGLKQAPRAWFHTFTSHLRAMGFEPSIADPNLWFGTVSGVVVFMVIVVDDTLITSSDIAVTMQAEKAILGKFKGSSSDAEWYCGMKLSWQLDGSVIVTQSAHVAQILEKYNLHRVKGRSTPMDNQPRLTKEGELLDTAQYPYASVVGACLYITGNTRPDGASTINRLAKYMSKPTLQHWDALMWFVGYLKSTANLGLHLGANMSDRSMYGKKQVLGYCDADYAGDLDNRRSHTGWVFLLNGGAIAWQSKCQPTVAASTTEAEYMAAASACKEALWLRQLLPVFGIECGMVSIKCDNNGAIFNIDKHKLTQRTKHIDVMHHFVRERAALKQVEYSFVGTAENTADILTKPMQVKIHQKHCESMGMISIDQ
jgi:Reverse transcriptase (RNA-dependent DNA polymerase)